MSLRDRRAILLCCGTATRSGSDAHCQPVEGRPIEGQPVAGGRARYSRRSAGRVRSYALLMLAAVAAITAVRLVWLAVQPADLYPDEAQYWFWAQQPALGYYSKPPLIAWLIALTTSVFGDGEFAIRLSAPLLHAVAAGFVYAIGARLYDGRVGFWAALAYLTAPGVSLSAYVISTDAALLPCWAAALYAFIRAREADGAGLVGRGRDRRRARAAREIRDGLLAALGVRLRAAGSGRAAAFAAAARRGRDRGAALSAESVVELEQRVRQLSACPRQCRPVARSHASGGVPRIPGLAIRGSRAAAFRRAAGDRGAPALSGRAARPPARRVCAAEPGDDAGPELVVAGPAELGGAGLCVGERAGGRLDARAGLAALGRRLGGDQYRDRGRRVRRDRRARFRRHPRPGQVRPAAPACAAGGNWAIRYRGCSRRTPD